MKEASFTFGYREIAFIIDLNDLLAYICFAVIGQSTRSNIHNVVDNKPDYKLFNYTF
jgi:hypothetical protein